MLVHMVANVSNSVATLFRALVRVRTPVAVRASLACIQGRAAMDSHPVWLRGPGACASKMQ